MFFSTAQFHQKDRHACRRFTGVEVNSKTGCLVYKSLGNCLSQTPTWKETNRTKISRLDQTSSLFLPVAVQSSFPLVRVPSNSYPFLSTHQHCPVEAWHCFSLKEPSSLHLGTKRPMAGSFRASCIFFWQGVNSDN